ncbi:MAG: hypothetical protein J6J24_00300 [Clostridia bacterium]|nr:hypothetical protein [Clostridia bacterium]
MSDLERAKAKKKTRKTASSRTKTTVAATAGVALAGVAISQAKRGKLWVFAFIFALILGVGGGYLAYRLICKNDCFVMNSYSNTQEVVDINIGGDETYKAYEEIGAKCIIFGKDMSEQVKVEYQYREDITHDPVVVEGVNLEKAGIYYAIYTIDNIRYKGVTLIRNIIVMREE